MTNKLTALLLALLITILLSGFYNNEHKPSKGIKFVSFSTTKINDTLVRIDATIDNGERERTFTVDCTIRESDLQLRAVVSAYYFNYFKTFTANIPIK